MQNPSQRFIIIRDMKIHPLSGWPSGVRSQYLPSKQIVDWRRFESHQGKKMLRLLVIRLARDEAIALYEGATMMQPTSAVTL